jgi:hypothetical protein
MRKETRMDDSTETPVCGCCRRVPISYLGLDLETPIVGWERFFADRGVEVASDHLGRRSIARWVVADLLDEQRARDARMAEEAAANAAALVQPLAVGLAAIDDAATAYETLMSAGSVSPDQEFGRPKPNFLVDEIEAGQRQAAAERETIRRRKEAR